MAATSTGPAVASGGNKRGRLSPSYTQSTRAMEGRMSCLSATCVCLLFCMQVVESLRGVSVQPASSRRWLNDGINTPAVVREDATRISAEGLLDGFSMRRMMRMRMKSQNGRNCTAGEDDDDLDDPLDTQRPLTRPCREPQHSNSTEQASGNGRPPPALVPSDPINLVRLAVSLRPAALDSQNVPPEPVVTLVTSTLLNETTSFHVSHDSLQRRLTENEQQDTPEAALEEDVLVRLIHWETWVDSLLANDGTTLWWNHTILYQVFGQRQRRQSRRQLPPPPPELTPIRQPRLLQRIQTYLDQVIGALIQSGSFATSLYNATGEEYLVVPTGQEYPETYASVETGGELWKGTYTTPLDQLHWETREWFGVGLVVFTVAVAVSLMLTGAHRRKQRDQQTLWGALPSLTTEQGVSELLKVGWKLNGEFMQVYDKGGKVGYRDDDSMLIGGYEQVAPTTSTDLRNYQ